MRRVLNQSDMDDQLREEGFVVVPLLETSQLAALRQLYAETHPVAPVGFYSSTHVADQAFRNTISERAIAIVAPSLDRLLDRMRLLGAALINKAPGANGILQPHQDWNIVDETAYRSFNIWIPLQDTHAANGAFQYLPQSHNRLPTYRSINLPNICQDVQALVWAHMTVLHMNAGEALLYDHRLIHGSHLNQTQSPRTALVIATTFQEADMRYYYQEGEGIGEYACTPAFYLAGNPAAGPAGLEQIRMLPVVQEQLDQTTFARIFQLPLPSKASRWQQLIHFFTP